MPTRVPFAAPSATVLAPALPSAGVDGATSLTAIENVCVVNNPLASAALTVMLWLVALSKSISEPSATVTTPVEESMANRPPALSLSENVTVPPLTSDEDAVMPTRVPFAAPSATVLAPALPSVGVDGRQCGRQYGCR